MKRNISNILMLFILFCGMTACEKEALPTAIAGINKSEELTFSFNARATATTENEIASEINLNEDKIETLDLFFFTETDKPYIVHRQYTNTNQDKNTTYTVNVSSEGLDMTGKTQYLVYAVVNRVIPEEEEYTLAELKELAAKEISVDNTTTDKDESIQTSFVMDGELSTTLSSSMTTPVIQLQRSVAKVTLDINVAKEIFVGSNKIKYTPILGTMTVKLVNGVKNGIINGFGTADYFETTTANPTTRSISEVADGNDCTPFYSYPYNWSGTNKDCHLYLSIQWESELGGLNTYYYIVPIGEVTELIRNNHYKINLDVAILGGTEEDPVTLNANYIIENWSTCEISTELKKYKYLWVKGREFVMNNVDEIKIDYASSSAIKWSSLTVQRYYSGGTNSAEELTTITNHGVTFTDNKDGTFSIKHEIKRTGTGKDLNNYYRPWYIEFDIVNNEGLIVENVKITQYPAIYAVADFNANGVHNRFVNGKNGPSSGRENAYDNNGGDIGTVYNLDNKNGLSVTNENKNQYTIYVTVLNEGSDYYIGDPRTKDVDNLSNLDLSNYHPAAYPTGNYQASANDKIIAPAFKIASSWGLTTSNGLTYAEAQKRCASYQENGYPAGRWRLPTEAEFKFVNQLSDDGYIPVLLSGNYWASSKRYYDSGEFKTTTNERSARCVYDVWYWGNEKIYNADGTTPTTTFTWGDEPITQK